MKEMIKDVSVNEMNEIISSLGSVIKNVTFHNESVFMFITKEELDEIIEIRNKLHNFNEKLKQK